MISLTTDGILVFSLPLAGFLKPTSCKLEAKKVRFHGQQVIGCSADQKLQATDRSWQQKTRTWRASITASEFKTILA